MTRGQALTRARWTTTLTLVAVLVDTLGWAVTAVLVALAAGFFAYVCQSDLPG